MRIRCSECGREYDAELSELPIGKRVELLRKRRGLTQADVAGELGVSQAQVCKFEGGRRDMRLKHMAPLADLLGVSIDALVRGTEANRG